MLDPSKPIQLRSLPHGTNGCSLARMFATRPTEVAGFALIARVSRHVVASSGPP